VQENHIYKQTENSTHNSFAKLTLKELLKFVVVITFSTLTYDFFAGAQIGMCSLLIGFALAYTLAKVYHALISCILDLLA
jgi:hypothetical protein